MVNHGDNLGGDLGRDLDEAVETLGARTELLLATARDLDDGTVAAPSLLPGWTRGHVLTHLARNADAMGNLLTWARTGVRTPMYPSAAARAADIEAGSGRGAAELREDLAASAARLDAALRELPAAAWGRTVALMGGQDLATTTIPWHRLKEVEIHHTDLGLGHRPGDWPDAFQERLLAEVLATRDGQGAMPPLRLALTDTGEHRGVRAPGPATPLVSGTRTDVLAWLLGRSRGGPLTRRPAGDLPELPPWI